MSQPIYIPFANFDSVGGPSTFMQNLQKYLDDNSYPYAQQLHNANAIFFPVAYPKNELKNIRRNSGVIIQRLDGIYYPSKHGKQYRQLNTSIKKIYNRFSDYVIFQSEYSRQQCFAMLGEIPKERYRIIINGVDKTTFYPNPDTTPPDNMVRMVTTGNFRNIDMIEPVVQVLDQLTFNFELTIIGPIANSNLRPFFNRPYINHLGSLSLHEIAPILRQQHIFIYSHLNPPCPNSVIEAVSCGLPVVGFASGAMNELLFFSKELLAPVTDKIFQEYTDFNPKSLEDKIQQVVDEYDHWRHIALANSHLYSFDTCGKAYIDAFNHAYTLPPTASLPFLERIKDWLSINQ